MANKAVGLLSPGDMGHVVGEVLIQNGLSVLASLDDRSDRTRKLAEKAGIKDLGTYTSLVENVDMVISILVPAEAAHAAERVVEALTETDRKIVYADCNAIAPSTARKIGEVVENAGSTFVDAGIIGGPPRNPGNTRFYCSGPKTSLFEELGEYGLDVRVVGDVIGQASGLKMCYAAQTKGYTALATELLIAAQAMGLYEGLIDELLLSQEVRYRSLERGIPGMPTKARRWVGEMEEIAKTFEDLGLTPKIYQGAADMFRLVGDTPLADESPENRDHTRTLAQVIKLLADGRK